jgi:hypothetical protein
MFGFVAAPSVYASTHIAARKDGEISNFMICSSWRKRPKSCQI